MFSSVCKKFSPLSGVSDETEMEKQVNINRYRIPKMAILNVFFPFPEVISTIMNLTSYPFMKYLILNY